MKWPNNDWYALSNQIIKVEDGRYQLSTIGCGKLKVPSGKLICCDPFSDMRKSENPYVQIPIGEYEVIVTYADVSPNLDGSHYREAYASLLIGDPAKEISRKCLEPSLNGVPTNKDLGNEKFYGFGVDAGTACFVDAESLKEGMPDEELWQDEIFDSGTEDSWFYFMDNPEIICEGLANIRLPMTKNDNNIIIIHSGWGDGFYPVIGGYDSQGNLIAIHIDFFVVYSSDSEDETEEEMKKPWWKFW